MQPDILSDLAQASVTHTHVLNEALDGVWRHDREIDGTIHSKFDDRYLEIMGWDDAKEYRELGGWEHHIHPDDLQAALALAGKHFATKGEHPYEIYVRYTHKDGHEIRIFCRGKVMDWHEDGTWKTWVGSHTLLKAMPKWMTDD